MNEFLTIEASAGGKPKVSGLAYSGGKMKTPRLEHPVVVDLGGMAISGSVPLLANHKNHSAVFSDGKLDNIPFSEYRIFVIFLICRIAGVF